MTRNEWGATCQAVLDASVPGTHFTPFEIADVGRRIEWTTLQAPAIPLLDTALRLIDVLEWVRAENFSAPILVNSWYRDVYYNNACGGAPGSIHMTLGAADIVKVGTEPEEVRELLEQHPDADKFGIGSYEGFSHIDIRGHMMRDAPARW